MGASINNICYLRYDGSIDTEKLEEGFKKVLSKEN